MSSSGSEDHGRTAGVSLQSGWWLQFLQVRLRFVILVGAVALLMAQWDRLQQTVGSLLSRVSGQQLTSEIAADHEYFCPMDPGVLSAWPAICSICNMDLVPRPGGGDHRGLRFVLAEAVDRLDRHLAAEGEHAGIGGAPDAASFGDAGKVDLSTPEFRYKWAGVPVVAGDVVLVGASERMPSVGGTIARNLVSGGFGGTIDFVNPRHSALLERGCYPAMADLPGVRSARRK